MAHPDKALIEGFIRMRQEACDEAAAALARVRAAQAAMHPGLFEELTSGLAVLADYMRLCRDWHSYLLMQYGIERGLYPADRIALGRMSRSVESFIRALAELRDRPAGARALARLAFPDEFPLS
jgi:hypothetical protein